jgi:hypothetical protein
LSILLSAAFPQKQKAEDLPVVSYDSKICYTTKGEELLISLSPTLPFKNEKDKKSLRTKLKGISGVELVSIEDNKVVFRYPKETKSPRNPGKVAEDAIKTISRHFRDLAFEKTEDGPP